MDMKNQQTLTLSRKISATKIVPNPSYAKIPFFFAALTLWRLHCESICSEVSAQSTKSLRRVSICRGLAMLCDSTETALRIIDSGVAVKVAKV